MNNWVTAYTDASFRDTGGWAVWLRSDAGRVVESGPCPDYVQDNMAAELYAMYKAVQLAISNWPDTVGVQINSDCMGVLRSLWPWSKPLSRTDLCTIQDEARSFIEWNGLKITARHIKGHQRPTEVRTYLNNRVDGLAGKHSRFSEGVKRCIEEYQNEVRWERKRFQATPLHLPPSPPLLEDRPGKLPWED